MREALAQALLPQPSSLDWRSGALAIGNRRLALTQVGHWSVTAQRRWSTLLAAFSGADRAAIDVQVCVDAAALQPDAGEAYSLVVSEQGIAVQAASATGLLRAEATLAQLLMAAGERIPCLRIDDAPQFAWRGLLLDPARRFLPLDALLRTLDGMARYKLNVLHLHLSDDQAFRFPSRGYAELNGGAACYSRDDLAVLIDRATRLGIRVVPEIDLPGHSTRILAAYPQLALFPVEDTTRFGVHHACLDPTLDATYEFVATLLDELGEVFPDECVHLGGDEVHPRWWSEHPRVQAYIDAEGLDGTTALQARFTQRVAELVAERGKRLVVWDEALDENLPQDTIVQPWRGMHSRDCALQAGHQCVVSAPYYLDLFFPADLHAAFTPDMSAESASAAEDALRRDLRLAHVAEGLEWTLQWRELEAPISRPEGALLGGEACLWGELVDARVLDTRLWSRLPYVAEALWRGASDGRLTRLPTSLAAWARLGGPDLCVAIGGGVSQTGLDAAQRAALGDDDLTDDVGPLLACLEPVKWYARLLGAEALAARLGGREMPQARPYQADTPLDDLADVLSPQSFVAAELQELLARWQRAPLDVEDQERLRGWAEQWARMPGAVEGLQCGVEVGAQLAALADRLAQFSTALTRLARFAGEALGPEQLAGLDGDFLLGLMQPVDDLLLAVVVRLAQLAKENAH
ncbi:MAG: family 20 glycosylhydrolase [Pseudomonadota bacterium]